MSSKIAEKSNQLGNKDKARLTRRGKLARTAAGVLLTVGGVTAANAIEPVHDAASAALNSVKQGAASMAEVAKGFSEPTEAEVLHDKYKDMRDNPGSVEPGKYFTYMVGDDENPSSVARLLSGEGVDDTELKRILVAQEDGNDLLQPGPVIVPAELVLSDDQSLQTQLQPFPMEEQQ